MLLPRSRRDLRLASGMVLFTYVTLHLASHTLGLVSLEAAEAALRTTVLLWHSWAGTALLYGAAAVHVGLALLSIYDRRTLRMAPMQALRIVLGLVMPVVLIGHFVGTRYAFERYGLPAEYSRVVATLWSSGAQGLSLGLLAPGWLHGCLGLRFAFGHRATWQRLRPLLFAAALLLPVLAALGFVTMGRELAREHASGDPYAAPPRPPHPPQFVALADVRDSALATYLALLGLVVVARALRGLEERRRRSVVRISYPGRVVTVPRGWSVLEASRSFGIAHQSTCGGRARCTTCRVRVVDGRAQCPEPGVDELRTLARIGAAGAVRLACQLRPTGDIAVEPVLAVERSRWRAAPRTRPTSEREVAVLFCEISSGGDVARGNASAHDTIYALGCFHAIVAPALEAAGGVLCRQAGDSWMALFGLDGSLAEGCGQALRAALRIEERSAMLCEQLARELGLDCDFSLGIDAGSAVVGTIDGGVARTVTAVGDAIRAAEQLRACAVRARVRFVISKSAAVAAGIGDDAALAWHPSDTPADGVDALASWAVSSAALLADRAVRPA